MAMSDSAYQRVVEEMKRQRETGCDDPLTEIVQQLARSNAAGFTSLLGSFVNHAVFVAKGDDTMRARAKAVTGRAMAMSERIKALSLRQELQELQNTAARLAKKYQDGTAPVTAYDAALDEIERELRIAERSPR